MRSGLLYRLLHPFAKISIGLYFSKIHIDGLEKIPRKGPLIIASNHPNSFTEACILATFQPRTLHFLVRGDVFRNPVIAFLLRQTNQLPIFRFKDGFSNLKQNESTFAACQKALAQGAAILIFSEASSVFEKRLRPIQKGTAKLAFSTLQYAPDLEDLQVLPVGVNYTHGDKFRSEVMINIDEPISVKSLHKEYLQDPKMAIQSLTSKIKLALENKVIQIHEKSREPIYDQCMDLADGKYSTASLWPLQLDNQRFQWEYKLARRINELTPEDLESLKKDLKSLRQLLPPQWKNFSRVKYLFRDRRKANLVLFGTFPLAAPGILYFAIPFYLGKLLAIPFLRYIEFYTGVRIGSTLIFGMVQGGFLSAVFLLTKSYYGLLSLLLVPMFGWFAVIWIDHFRTIHTHASFRNITDKSRVVESVKTILDNWGL